MSTVGGIQPPRRNLALRCRNLRCNIVEKLAGAPEPATPLGEMLADRVGGIAHGRGPYVYSANASFTQFEAGVEFMIRVFDMALNDHQTKI